MFEDEDGFIKALPVGPWQVIEDDEDGTFELFDIGMAKLWSGIPYCNVWVFCHAKLRVGKIYRGEMVEDRNQNYPVFLPKYS